MVEVVGARTLKVWDRYNRMYKDSRSKPKMRRGSVV